MNSPKKRLWGIDFIAAICLAAIIFARVSFNGPDVVRTFGMIVAAFCAFLSLGIAARVNAVRVILMFLLVIAVTVDALLILFFLGAIAGVFQSPPNKPPTQELLATCVKLATAMQMFLYLKRNDVRAAFQPRQAYERMEEDVSFDNVDV